MLAEQVGAAPAGGLRPFVRCYTGYHYRGFGPGVHVGMPSTALTVVLSLDAPTTVTLDADRPFADFQALVSGLDTKPAYIRHEGTQFGIQLDLTPAGARALLGVPAAALSGFVVDLADLLGSASGEIVERLAAAPDWASRFALLDSILARLARPRTTDSLDVAWQRVVASFGAVKVADLAAEIGWSRRHLHSRFQHEFGVGPKDMARVARFERSRQLLARKRTFAEVAAACGYFDQAHMARDWRDFAGMPPSAWLASEELPILPSEAGG